MPKDIILKKLQQLHECWDTDDCIDWAYWAIEEINLILNSEEKNDD